MDLLVFVIIFLVAAILYLVLNKEGWRRPGSADEGRFFDLESGNYTFDSPDEEWDVTSDELSDFYSDEDSEEEEEEIEEIKEEVISSQPQNVNYSEIPLASKLTKKGKRVPTEFEA